MTRWYRVPKVETAFPFEDGAEGENALEPQRGRVLITGHVTDRQQLGVTRQN